MTTGILLVLIGIKLNLVESYLLTPMATRFWMERIEDPSVAMKNGYNPYSQPESYPSLFQQASYAMSGAPALPQKVLVPPQWLCWPTLFLGFVMLLHGLSVRKNN